MGLIHIIKVRLNCMREWLRKRGYVNVNVCVCCVLVGLDVLEGNILNIMHDVTSHKIWRYEYMYWAR